MIYNKIIFSAIFSIAFQTLFFAQSVGIGTSTPNSSALLDLDVSSMGANQKKGLLIPRLALTDRTDIVTVPNPATGLLVFNTTNSATDTSIEANTFYYWNGSRWIDIATSKTYRSKLYPQVFIIANTGSQNLDKASFNNGNPQIVNFEASAAGAMAVNVGDRVSVSNNNFKILTSGYYEITGYVGYNPWIQINCTTQPTEATCTASLDFIFQRSTNEGSTWVPIAKTSTLWGVGTGDRNRSVMIAPFVISLNKDDLIRAVVVKGSATNHGSNPSNSTLNIEPGTGLAYSRLLRIQKID